MPSFTAQTGPVDMALISLHYAYPVVVFGYFVVSSAIAVLTLSDKKKHPRRRPLLVLMLLTVLSYIAQIITITIPYLFGEEWLGQQDAVISLLSCILAFGLQLVLLSDGEEVAWYPFIGPYLIALGFEPALEIVALFSRDGTPLSGPELAQLIVIAFRFLAIGLVVATYFSWRNIQDPKDATDSERQPLIPKNPDGTPAQNTEEESSQPSSSYGSTMTTVTDNADDSSTDDSNGSDSESSSESTKKKRSKSKNGKAKDGKSKDGKFKESENTNELPWERRERKRREEMEKRLKENGNWFDYAKRFLIFFPYIWPVNNRRLQIHALLVGVCLLANNALNVLVPRQLGIIMDSLSHDNDKNPWIQVIIFAGLKFASSQAGISLLRQWLWIPVEYYSFGAMSIATYSHVLGLSSDFHDSKSSSDIMVAISSGQSISSLLESICFSAIPMLIDMTVAFIYLSAMFGAYEGFITFATSTIFLYIAGRMIARLKTARRSEVSAWFEEHYVRQAGIQGWSTVASFNQVQHEEERYSNAVKTRVARTQEVYVGYLLAYALQYLVLLAGLLAGAFLAVWQVTSGKATPGQFVMLLTYWTQLVAPLTFFASLGKTISRNFIHAEQLLEIMNTKPTVTSKENAPSLEFSGGSVEFKDVSFAYNGKKDILKHVSFHVQPGMTVAFVGATGAGKSTILKLLDRFYDVTEGSIKIDGQDIRDVDLHSLRSRIGIVPQAPVLFNDTIMNNVRYAKLDAADEEVYDACRAAAVHDQILGFSEGYNSRVGERGIKLSGGELQRVAIARAILKNPSIVLLDEATSSVDTETEQKIQEALQALCSGRTTFIVAHRLSTVMNADCIIVISDGEIVEQGSHDELIQANGKYANLWSKQIFVKSKDKSPAGKTSDLVNDLSLAETTNEVAKVKRSLSPSPASETSSEATKGGTSEDTPKSTQENDTKNTGEVNGSAEGDSNNSTSRDDDSGSDTATEANLAAVRKNEENRLNPVASPFTPRALSAVPMPASLSKPSPTSSDTIPKGTASPSPIKVVDDKTIVSQPEEHLNPETLNKTESMPMPTGRQASFSGAVHGSSSGHGYHGILVTDPNVSSENHSPNDPGSQIQTYHGSMSRGSFRGRGRFAKSRWSRPRNVRRDPEETRQNKLRLESERATSKKR